MKSCLGGPHLSVMRVDWVVQYSPLGSAVSVMDDSSSGTMVRGCMRNAVVPVVTGDCEAEICGCGTITII